MKPRTLMTVIVAAAMIALLAFPLVLGGCASAPPPAEAKVEGGTAKIEQRSEDRGPTERRERRVRLVIKNIPAGSVNVQPAP